MYINENTCLSSSQVLLVPYASHHVPTYHEWMQDPEIQEVTASEPLTLQEEYEMQQSWRKDPDKLTFISCLPLRSSTLRNGDVAPTETNGGDAAVRKMQTDAPGRMLGDVNLFLKLQESDDHSVASGIPASTDVNGEDKTDIIVGEIELMIPERHQQRKGYGRATLICFLRYIVDHQLEIVGEFVDSLTTKSCGITALSTSPISNRRFGYLVVRIAVTNARSVTLFESLGFTRITEEPNFFGELELRRYGLTQETVDGWLRHYGLNNYRELEYN